MLPLVITIEGSEGTRRYAFADSPIRIGRSPFAELQLTEPHVSRWEGTLRFDDAQLTYFPTGTTNPTYVDGQLAPPHEEVSLTLKSVLVIGGFELRFNREQVPETDLRRKGKRQPADAGERSVAATLWSGNQSVRAPSTQGTPESTSQEPPRQGHERARQENDPSATTARLQNPSSSEPPIASTAPRVSPDVIRTLGSVRVVSDSGRPPAPAPGQSFGGLTPPSSRSASPLMQTVMVQPGASPAAPQKPVEPEKPASVRPPAYEPPASVRPPAYEQPASVRSPAFEPPTSVRPVAAEKPASVRPPAGPAAFYQQYREAFRSLFEAVSRELESAPASSRAALVADIAQRYPQLQQESDYRALLRRLEVPYPRADAPAVGDWLRDTMVGLLAPNIRVDTGLTLERVLALLETLTQSFAEINTAQDTVRKRWLGRAPRSSVLSSDEGKEILAYLLNPMADWNARVAELEENIREVIGHELALLRATMEGARGLLAALSPETLASAEGVELPEDEEEEEEANGLWKRITAKNNLIEPRLWRRFVSTYEELMESDRYQRVFLGRDFARSYLAAMGQAEQPERKGRKD